MTLWLSRFEKRAVLLAMMGLFVVGNVLSAFSTGYWTLLLSRVIAGLTQGPFYGIGAVVATRLVPPRMAGRAVGQMFAGLTLANVLGVPAGAWIGNTFGWQASFGVVAVAGAIAAAAIAVAIRRQAAEATGSMAQQLAVFRSRDLRASLVITVLGWSGFMCFYGYVAPIAEGVAGYAASEIWWVLVVIGVGLVLGNSLGGRSADANLHLSLVSWPAAMTVSLLLVGLVASQRWPFLAAAFVFGVTSFANVAPMQMRVMIFGAGAPELAATANISAFNIANAIGGIVGGGVIDSHYGAPMTPFIAAVIPAAGLIFIVNEERKRRTRPAPALMSS